MSRLLLAFALVQGLAAAAFLWAPLPPEGRAPGDLLPWTLGAAACFMLVAWPLLEARVEGVEQPYRDEALAVAGRGVLLLLAVVPFVSASLALAPLPARESLRALLPLLGAWGAGGLLAWSVRAGGAEVGRAVAAAALAGLALGPIARMLSGAAGADPGPSITVAGKPWLLLAAPLFVAAAVMARRLRGTEAA
ncbi:MAG: hypothetical protein AAB074_07330 [Planctomycetota bacterium]